MTHPPVLFASCASVAGFVSLLRYFKRNNHTAAHASVSKTEAKDHLADILALGQRFVATAYRVDNPVDGKNVKIIHFVRHGEGYHNKAATEAGYGCTCMRPDDSRPCPYTDPVLLDPGLTPLGVQQAAANSSVAPSLGVELVVVSPMNRAIQTAVESFASVPDVPFLAHEDAREQSGEHICDKRQTRHKHQEMYPHIDFSLLESEEDELWTTERESRKSVADRCDNVLKYLSTRPEKNLALVTHSSYLLTLFNAALDCKYAPELKEWFQTGELRSVKIQF
mmetsp:Transcript_16030/g.31392  ORF Transcript_16030/g.31392 Transcript_16030/m.31392 type:complete len:280 (+) Transcript_16030:1-840(+)